MWLLTYELGVVPSLRDSSIIHAQPGTTVPGYRLYGPGGTLAKLVSAFYTPECSSKTHHCGLIISVPQGRNNL
jgi:hypothetical protein